MMPDVDPNDLLLRRSIKWRVAAGWIMVLILLWRYLGYSVWNVANVYAGGEPLPPLDPIEWQDVLAIIGLPVGGAFADRLNND